MTDLERRALLGDLQAQNECTRRGIVLPCPFCGGDAKVKVQKVQYGLSGTIIRCTKCLAQLRSPDARAVCVSGGLKNVPIVNHREICIGRWNTRPAPPIGRCVECANSPNIKTKTKGMRWCRRFRKEVDPGGYCDGFKPKGGEENG